MRFVKYLLIIGLLALFVSCDDFLQVNPKSNITSESFYQNEADAIAGVNAVYGALKLQGLWPRGIYLNFELASDNAIPGIGVENPDINDVNFYTHSANNNWIMFFYRDSYQLINRANMAIDNIVDLEIDGDVKLRLLAEARFLRAWVYFHLVRGFGEVPLTMASTTWINYNCWGLLFESGIELGQAKQEKLSIFYTSL